MEIKNFYGIADLKIVPEDSQAIKEKHMPPSV